MDEVRAAGFKAVLVVVFVLVFSLIAAFCSGCSTIPEFARAEGEHDRAVVVDYSDTCIGLRSTVNLMPGPQGLIPTGADLDVGYSKKVFSVETGRSQDVHEEATWADSD